MGCPGYTPFCNPMTQVYTGAIDAWNPLIFFTTVHTDGTPVPGVPTPLPGAAGSGGQLNNIQGGSRFAGDAANGTLPPVSWVVPSFLIQRPRALHPGER